MLMKMRLALFELYKIWKGPRIAAFVFLMLQNDHVYLLAVAKLL